MSTITPVSGDLAPSESDAQVASLIREVGAQVRALREARGIPRRLLSDRSGVSPRYLAQLEAGEGNISIGLLQRVAIALDHPIEKFFGSAGAPGHSIDRLFNTASEDVQQAVLRLLTGEARNRQRAQRICLVGLRGAGKSTLGARMSAVFDLPFVELNREIEIQSGMPVSEVMALYGQEGYRSLEARAMERVVATHDRVILAVAGGIVAEADTYSALLSNFHTIWIRTSPEEHMARVRAQGDERPMAGNPEAMEQLKSILTAREALYARAEAQLDTSGKSVERSAAELQTLIATHGFLD
jgi:XRE family aerobic/anaerobic benzoate catabolism transcriptional regulator